MTTQPIRTMQDLLNALPRLGYSKATINQIRPRIKDCAKIYNAPLNRVSADLAAFESKWGKGRVGALAAGFKSVDHFLEFRKRVGGALARAQAPATSTAPRLPEWQRLCAFVKANSGPRKPLGPHRTHGVAVLADAMSAHGIVPAQVTDDTINLAAAPLKTVTRRTFKRGLFTVNDLVARRDAWPEIATLLPAAPIAQPGRVKSVPSPFRWGACPEAAQLWADFDRFVAEKRGTDDLGRPIPERDSEFKASTARTYENAVTNATGLLSRSGDLQPCDAPRLRDICCLRGIQRFAEFWQVRMFDGDVRKDAGTLHLNVERLAHIAQHQGFLTKMDTKKPKQVRDKIRKAATHRNKMSAPRLAWIKAFARSPAQKRAVHAMPESLMRQAQVDLDRWDELERKKRHKQRMRALKLGIAAVQAALLFRGSAVRAGNLRGLTFRGTDAQLLLCPDSGDVRISIPGHLVKTGAEIDADADDDARPVIDWYLAEIRPRLIDDHPYGRGLVDSDFLFPSTRSDRPMEETTFAEHYRVGVEAVGLDMTLHQARHVTAYFILDADPNALGLAAAILGIDPGTVRDHYAWMDSMKAVAKGRELLREARKAARKHRKGNHNVAA